MQRNTEFGTLLTTARLAAGYSQREVAEFTKISRSAYGHMELCIRKPSAEFILRISALYHANPITFLQPLIPDDLFNANQTYLCYLTKLSACNPNTNFDNHSRRKRIRNHNHISKN